MAGKEKRTERIHIRILPSAKKIAEENAEEQKRTLSSYIEQLILNDKGDKKMKKYLVNFNTGAGSEYADTIEDAKELAVKGMAYTQESVSIEDTEANEVVCVSRWWGVSPEEDEEVLAQFGNFGYYGEWEEF